MRMIKQAAMFILMAGVGLALLRAFGGDPIAVIEWAIDWIWRAIERVAEFFGNNESFREVTRKPSN